MLQSLADDLTRVIALAAADLRRIDDARAAAKPSADVWSVKEIVGHLVDSAANNHQRFVRTQEDTAFAFPGYEQDAWVAAHDYQSQSWPELVDFWVLYNRHLAHVIRRMPVSLSVLVEDYLVHLRHHLKQIEDRR